MKILLVEDERSLSRAVTTILTKNGYSVDNAYDGIEALECLDRDIYDGVVMDIMMPRMDGLEVLTNMRKRRDNTPVLLLTAKSEIDDKVDGLDRGANDYLAKPFAARELLARIRAMTRVPSERRNSRLTLGNVTMDFSTFELSSPYGCFRLSNKEFRMMEILAREKKVPARYFLDDIWKDDPDAGPRIVLVYISYLRSKLSALHADKVITSDHDEYLLEDIQ